jgi:hypothetical protein
MDEATVVTLTRLGSILGGILIESGVVSPQRYCEWLRTHPEDNSESEKMATAILDAIATGLEAGLTPKPAPKLTVIDGDKHSA